MSDEMRDSLLAFVSSPAFLRRYPCYAAVLAQMVPVNDPSVGIIAVSAHGGRFYLHANVEFFVRHPQFLMGLLLHEVHHVVLGHLNLPKFSGLAHPDLLELAMEVSANEYIQEPLPGKPVTWVDLREFGLRAGQSTMQRYELLATGRLQGRDPRMPSGPWVDDHLRSGVGSVHVRGAQADSRVPEQLRRLIEEAASQAKGASEERGASVGLLAGKRPGQLLEELTPAEEPEQPMDWRAAVRMFVALVRTPVHTYSRPNRRFPDKVGQIPGRIFFPGPGEKPSIIVAIDTSSSMSRGELAEVARQLLPLSGLVRITVVECDVVIQRVFPFRGAIHDVAGRGGTDLRPVFAPDFLREHRCDGVIFFTDGCGPYPGEDPGVKTLWVLSKPREFSCPWGRRALLPRKEHSGLSSPGTVRRRYWAAKGWQEPVRATETRALSRRGRAL